MLELATELDGHVNTTFVSFSEGGLCQDFLDKVRERGFTTRELANDTPHLLAARRELHDHLKEIGTDVLCCHGYKANLLGLLAARRLGVPAISVSRGWTGECWKVRVYEWLDRRVLRRMDRVVCVSEGQARKVRAAGVPGDKVVVIRNAVRTERFAASPDATYRRKLESLFAHPPTHILGAAGRLSPEKGFDVLIEACRRLATEDKRDFGVVLFGDGPLREPLQQRIDAAGLTGRFVLGGFTDELDRFMPHFEVFVQSSHTEGMPNVLLEAAAAGVPVVATDVGGTSEVVAAGRTGHLVASGDASALADGIWRLLEDPESTHAMKQAAPDYAAETFGFEKQAARYTHLFERLLNPTI